MTWGTRLDREFQGKTLIHAAGAHNALGAKLVERAGFDAVWVSGLEVSASFALPDVGLLTMTELLDVARQIIQAISIPVIIDCDTGFGDPVNVARLLRLAATNGVAAICIEDKTFPKRNSFLGGRHELLDPESFCKKLRVARQVTAGEIGVIARTETLVAGGSVDEALRRCECYVQAGAHAVLVHCKDRTPDQVVDFLGRWQNETPVVVVPTTYHGISMGELEKEGASMVIFANQGLRSAVRAMRETLASIHATGSSASVEDSIASLDDIFDLQDTDSWLDLQK